MGGREGRRERGREGGMEGVWEGGREGGREGGSVVYTHLIDLCSLLQLHCELFKRRKLSKRVKKSRKIGTQLGIEPRTF